MTIDRREFIKRAGMLGGAAAAATALPGCRRLFGKFGPHLNGPGMLQIPAQHSPVDHVVVLMMENRSFDHWLGWLAEDHGYLEAGRRRYGRSFNVDGNQHQTFQGATGPVQTERLVTNPDQTAPYQGCGFGDPGHSWTQGRAQRDGGFLAPGSRNDEFALGYYIDDDLPFTSQLAKSFTTFDRYHASLLGPTWPNREYLHSAQSGGQMSNDLPVAGLSWETIWNRLIAANVPSRYYYSDLPFLALFGPSVAPVLSPIENYYADSAAGTLPNVTFLDPKFVGPEQCDDHPLADIRRGQAFTRDTFKAFAQSKHWHNGAFIITYDEWGGFFDHVAPPQFADDRASTVDAQNFGQGGFRVPTIVASPFAAARLRRPPHVRAHVDPAIPRVAVPRRAAGGTGQDRGHLVPHQPRPQRRESRREPDGPPLLRRHRVRPRRHRPAAGTRVRDRRGWGHRLGRLVPGRRPADREHADRARRRAVRPVRCQGARLTPRRVSERRGDARS